jgi:FtsZ-binding cell division protein ZapB
LDSNISTDSISSNNSITSNEAAVTSATASANGTDSKKKEKKTKEKKIKEEKNSIFLSILYSIGNFFLLNIVFVLLLVPVVTIGAALTAYYDLSFTKKVDRSRKDFSVKNFLNKFKEHFKLTTSYFLCYLVVIGFFVAFALLFSSIGPIPNKILSILFIVLSGLIFSVLLYTFPVIAINTVTLKQEEIDALKAKTNSAEEEIDEEAHKNNVLSNYMKRFSKVKTTEEKVSEDYITSLQESLAKDNEEEYKNRNSIKNILLDSTYFAAKHFVRLIFTLFFYLFPAILLYYGYRHPVIICILLVLLIIRILMGINSSLYFNSFFDYDDDIEEETDHELSNKNAVNTQTNKAKAVNNHQSNTQPVNDYTDNTQSTNNSTNDHTNDVQALNDQTDITNGNINNSNNTSSVYTQTSDITSIDNTQTSDSAIIDSQTSDSQVNDSHINESQASDSQASDSQANDSQANDSQVNDSQVNDSQVNDSQKNDSHINESQASDSQIDDPQLIISQADKMLQEALHAEFTDDYSYITGNPSSHPNLKFDDDDTDDADNDDDDIDDENDEVILF